MWWSSAGRDIAARQDEDEQTVGGEVKVLAPSAMMTGATVRLKMGSQRLVKALYLRSWFRI